MGIMQCGGGQGNMIVTGFVQPASRRIFRSRFVFGPATALADSHAMSSAKGSGSTVATANSLKIFRCQAVCAG